MHHALHRALHRALRHAPYHACLHCTCTAPAPHACLQVEGVPLSEFMAHVGCTHPEAQQIMRQVCAAIRHAHKAGVCHRDLRLENVMLQQGAQCNVKASRARASPHPHPDPSPDPHPDPDPTPTPHH